jgi:hypothetical protein
METKTASEAMAEYYEAVCKAQGISLEELFKRNPGEYQRYKKMTDVQTSTKIRE